MLTRRKSNYQMNKLLRAVILAQLLNRLVLLLFMKLLGLGGQGERVAPLPCFLRQSLLLSLKLPVHLSRLVIKPQGSLMSVGLQMCATSILTCLVFCFGNPIQVLQALYPLNHLCSSWSYFFNCEIVQL